MKKLIIKNDKQLQKVLDTPIKQNIYWSENPLDSGTLKEGKVYIDRESIMDNFEFQLDEIINAVENY